MNEKDLLDLISYIARNEVTLYISRDYSIKATEPDAHGLLRPHRFPEKHRKTLDEAWEGIQGRWRSGQDQQVP